MPSEKKSFDFWYAVRNTQVVHAPSRALETFGETRIHYYHLAELPDVPGKVRVREGRLEAHKPLLITPEAYVQEEMAGFGEQARQYLEFLKQHQDAIRILQYGYRLSQEAFSEQVVTDSLDAVAERVEGEVKRSEDPFAAVIKGVDDPWDVGTCRSSTSSGCTSTRPPPSTCATSSAPAARRWKTPRRGPCARRWSGRSSRRRRTPRS